MAENFPVLLQNNNLHIHEAKQIPSRINAKRSTNRYIIIKVLKVKDKEQILNSVRRKIKKLFTWKFQ